MNEKTLIDLCAVLIESPTPNMSTNKFGLLAVPKKFFPSHYNSTKDSFM